MDDTFKKIKRTVKDKETKTLIELTLKTSEELGELSEAVLSYTHTPGNAYKGKTQEDVLEEAVDVIQCALAVAFRADPNLTIGQLKGMFQRKLEKWQTKLAENPRK